MQPMPWRLASMLAALWWGGSAALAFVAVPLAFSKLGSAALAGPLAAQYFTVLSWLTLFCGLGLLALSRARLGARGIVLWVLLAMLAALLQEHAVASRILTARATGGDLRFWHTLGSLMVLLQWLCATWVLWRLTGDPLRPQDTERGPAGPTVSD